MIPEKNFLELNALIQYQYGRYANKRRDLIPNHVVAAAVAAYDPAGPKAFDRVHSHLIPRPACPRCGENGNIRMNGRLADGEIRWRCTRAGCWKIFSS